MPVISIILPVYNGEETVFDTISSLLNQTFTDLELCVCIDGSNDRSEEIIEAIDDKRISLIRNEKNMGLGRTLNRLVASVNPTSTYIAMAEQDDYYYPDRLKMQVEFLEKNKEVGLVSGIAEHFDGEKVTFSFPGLLVSHQNYPTDFKENFLLNYCFQVKVANSCMMFRKSVHIQKGLYFSAHYPSISVDWSYILRFSLVSRIQGLPVPLVRLDRRPKRNSLTAKKQLQFTTARQVIHDFYFEHRSLITTQNFKTALTTEYLLELPHKSYPARLALFLTYFLQNPADKRWLPFFKKQILKIK